MKEDLSTTLGKTTPNPRKEGTRGKYKTLLVAAAVPLGLLAVFAAVFREQLTPAVAVVTAPVTLLVVSNEAEPSNAPSEMLFQASGWIEPAPWRTVVPFKTDGFVEAVFVREGDAVTNGQLLAVLDDADARFDLRLAEANARESAAAHVGATNAVFVAEKEAETARFRVDAAIARAAGERDVMERFANASPGAVSSTDRVAAKQAVVEFEAEERAARAALAAMEARVASAEADANVAASNLAGARERVRIAELALARTRVVAPMSGVVSKRYVDPGDKRMSGGDELESSAVVALYDPARLQVRVDVPLAEAARAKEGQPARIVSSLLPGKVFKGRVDRVVGRADLQRNTLQVKVLVEDPDPRMRPEVLCRVEFWSAKTAGETRADASGGRTALWVPEAALESSAKKQRVWIVNPLERVLESRDVEVSGETRGGFRRVVSGLRANERVVIEAAPGALKDGARAKEMKR